MLNLKKILLAGTVIMGMLAQTASANFYVIPVGQSPIPTSSVKSFSSSCLYENNTGGFTLPYIVPEGKAFVVTTIRVSSCSEGMTRGMILIGPNYQERVYSSDGINFPAPIYNYNVGIVMNAGEQISYRILSGGTSSSSMISVSGYETRP